MIDLTTSYVDPELLSDDELAEMLAFAREVEARPVREYVQRGPVAGGPKHVDPDVLLEARVSLRAARFLEEHNRDLHAESKLLICQRMDEWLRAGVPVQFIAEAVGYNARSQVYYAVNERLPRLLRERQQRHALLQQLKQQEERR